MIAYETPISSNIWKTKIHFVKGKKLEIVIQENTITSSPKPEHRKRNMLIDPRKMMTIFDTQFSKILLQQTMTADFQVFK